MSHQHANPGTRSLIRLTVVISTKAAQRLASPALGIYGLVRACFMASLLSVSLAGAQTTTGNSTTGAGLWVSKGCSASCHTTITATKANAINAGGHIAYANTQGMGGQADSTGTQYNDIAAYFATLFTDLAAQSVSFETAKSIAIPNISLNTGNGDYVGLRQVSAPLRGLTTFTLGSTTMTYTPNNGQCGSDSFTYEAYRATTGTSNTRTVSLTIANPNAPDISTSSGSVSGAVGTAISNYTPVSTGGTPTGYSISIGTLPSGLSLNTSTGTISGTPLVSGNVTVTLSAFNCFNGVLAGRSGTKSITFTIITVPGAPTIGTATPGNAQLSVAFTGPASTGNSAITSYTATCGGISASGASPPVVVTGLTNGTGYTCTVKATNAAGTGAASGPSSSATPFTVPGAPTIGTATPGNGTLSVAFTSGSAGGSAITGYSATCGGFTNTGANSPIVVSGLTNGTAYTCTVVATNAAGPGATSGPSSSATPFTVPGAPTIGTATAGNSLISVAFTAPLSTGGSAITGYTATCGAFSNTGPSSPIMVSGLTNGTAYTCTVIATNAAGPGAASGPSNSATPGAVVPPGAPTIGSATPGDTQATIVFTPPASDGGGAIIDYTATCTPGNITGTNAVSPITVPGLVNGTAYSCSVTARNVSGPGLPSTAVPVTPLPPLALAGVVSSKTHGAAGNFSLVINTAALIGGLVDVEPRTIGSGHTLVFTFNNPIAAAGSVSVTDSANAMVGAATSIGSGNDVVVTLTGVPDNNRVTVTLTNVNGVVTPFTASLGFLVGDVNNTRSVNSSDISGVKARSGQTTTASNFKFDVNATGAINSSDISAVKARSGLTLPP